MSTSRLAHRELRRAAGPAWAAVLLALTTGVIAGIIAMHGFSVGHHAVTDQTVAHAFGHEQPGPTAVHPCPTGSCDDTGALEDAGAMGAMCLFVLLSLALTLRGRGRAVWLPRRTWPTPHLLPVDGFPPGVRSRELLTRLCISRT